MKFTFPKILLGFVILALVFNSCFKDELLKEIDDLRSQLTSIQKRNDSLNSVLNVRADSLSKALASAQKRSDSLSNVLKTKSDSLSNALGLTNANLTTLTKSVDSIKTQIATINGQLTQLNTQLTSITTQLTQLNQQLGALGGDVSKLATQYQMLSASLQTINSQIAVLQAEQLKLLEKLNAILLQLNPPADITTGLVAYYPFNGNAGDSSGYGNHGITNGVALTTDRFGKIGNAYSFNGVSNYITIPYNQIFNLSDSFTISVWINSTNVSLGQRIIDRSTPGDSNDWLVDLSPTPQYVNKIRCIAGGVFNLNNHPTSNATIVQNNTWYLVTVTYDRQNIKFYINGIIDRIIPLTTPTPASNNIVRIGAWTTGNFGFFNGKIDDIRIYKRALKQSDILYLSNN